MSATEDIELTARNEKRGSLEVVWTARRSLEQQHTAMTEGYVVLCRRGPQP
jgi:hypothetical protein